MSNYEKEMENEFEKFWDSGCHGWGKERCAEFNLSKISFEAGAKWQAERLTIDKITTILIKYKCKNLSLIAREIVAELRGEDEK